jgi:hypothetical protein
MSSNRNYFGNIYSRIWKRLHISSTNVQPSSKYRTRAYIGLRFARGFQNSLHVRLHNLIIQETGVSHPKSFKSKCTCGWTMRTMHRKYKRLDGGQAYDPSGVLTAISEWLNKLRHNLLHKPALTEVLCISCVNIIY